MPHRIAVAVAALAAALTLAAPAAAATVEVEDGVLTYTAEPGEGNEVDAWSDPDVSGLVYVIDYTSDVSPGPGCAPVPDPVGLAFMEVFVIFHCFGVDSASFDFGDESDFGYLGLDQPVTARGGPGGDVVIGGAAEDVLLGDDGHDRLNGNGGADAVDGGAGDDILEGDFEGFDFEEGPASADRGAPDVLTGGDGDDYLAGGGGADALAGGAGADTVDYSSAATAVTVTLDGAPGDGAAGENDALAGDVENVIGGRGDDVITGSPAANRIEGHEGADRIDPGAGEDKVGAGEGDDTVELRDGATDAVECGEGLPDRVSADAADVAGGDCEIIERPAGAVGPPPASAPIAPTALTVKVRRISGGRRARVTGRLVLPAGSAVSCSGSAVTVRLTGARRARRVTVPLTANCRYAATVAYRPARGRRLRARASYVGGPLIGPVSSRR